MAKCQIVEYKGIMKKKDLNKKYIKMNIILKNMTYKKDLNNII